MNNSEAMTTEESLKEALNELVHACQDLFDDYGHINEACAKAKALLPDYSEEPMFKDY